MALSHDVPVVSPPGPDDSVHSEQLHLRTEWDMHLDQTGPSTRYNKVKVLLLSWGKQDDDLGVAEEVDKLGKVFEEEYGFQIQKKTLDTNKNAQQQALFYLSQFAYEEDSAHDLLIIYYAGHGYSEVVDGGNIKLIGRRSGDKDKEKRNSVDWGKVENAISETDADVLVIFDCCHAGMLCQTATRGPARCFQYLGACEKDARTQKPGKNSFTTAMTWALTELATWKYFSVRDLEMHIVRAPDFPKKKQKPVFFDSRWGRSDDDIYFVPKRSQNIGLPTSTSTLRSEQGDYLDIRLHLDAESKRNKTAFGIAFGDLKKEMKRVKTKLGLRKVAFLGKNRVGILNPRTQHMWHHAINYVRPKRGNSVTAAPVWSDSTTCKPTIGVVTSNISPDAAHPPCESLFTPEDSGTSEESPCKRRRIS